MRVAFYGGSFDPPHLGHLRIAQAAADRLGLDRVLLAPAALQPLKRGGAAPASYDDRLAMVRLLCRDAADRRLFASELDAPRSDGRPNYTWDTLARLRATLGGGDALFVLTGADSFLTLHQWHRAAELLLAADWIVAARPGFALDPLGRVEDALPPGICAVGAGEQHPSWTRRSLTAAPAGACQATAATAGTASLYLLPDLREEISATEIRAALAGESGPPQQVLAPSVLGYIEQHGLYR